MGINQYGAQGRMWLQPGGREGSKRRHPAQGTRRLEIPEWAITRCNLHGWDDKYECPACIERGDEDDG